jgi:hypothetical protein
MSLGVAVAGSGDPRRAWQNVVYLTIISAP